MQILIAGDGGSKKRIFDGQKFLSSLNLSEENLTPEQIVEALVNLSEEEREELFYVCMNFGQEDIIKLLNIINISREERPTICFDMPKETEYYKEFLPMETRTPEAIKKELKYEKNPMRIRQLNSELTTAYKTLKGKW